MKIFLLGTYVLAPHPINHKQMIAGKIVGYEFSVTEVDEHGSYEGRFTTSNMLPSAANVNWVRYKVHFNSELDIAFPLGTYYSESEIREIES